MNFLYFIKGMTIPQTACTLTNRSISCKVDRRYGNMNCNGKEAKDI